MCAKTIKINESFICQQCGFSVPEATKTCRNHCPQCLYSLHVDGPTPGDRKSNCHGLMAPIALEQSGKGYIIVHRCEDCGMIRRNKVLEDDCWDRVIELSQSCAMNDD